MRHWRLLSPAGVAAVTILELSGDLGGLEFVDEHDLPVDAPSPGRVRHAFLRDGPGVVDEVLLVGVPGGVELHLHGGEVLFAQVGALLDRLGLQRWDDGAECDQALSLRHARALLSRRAGPMSRLVSCLADVPDGAERPDGPLTGLSRAVGLVQHGSRLARPAVVRIVGRPNAGKSTLFNAWVGRERALVSPLAGTTRDTVRAMVLLRGVPIQLEDAAGGGPEDAEPAGADLLVHLLSDAEQVGAVAPPDVLVMDVLGHADRRQSSPGMRAVSGLTGAGLAALIEDVADALGISSESSDDVWTPVSEACAQALQAAARRATGPV